MAYKSEEQIKDNKWKLIGTYTGATNVSLPSEYSEIMITFFNGRGSNYDNFVQIIPKEVLSSSSKSFLITSTIPAQSYNAYIQYTISLTSFQVNTSAYGGQSHIAGLETQVFYR